MKKRKRIEQDRNTEERSTTVRYTRCRKKKKSEKRSRSVKENEEKRERNDDGVSTEREKRKRRSRTKEAGIRYERTGTIDRQRRIKKRLGREEERMTD